MRIDFRRAILSLIVFSVFLPVSIFLIESDWVTLTAIILTLITIVIPEQKLDWEPFKVITIKKEKDEHSKFEFFTKMNVKNPYDEVVKCFVFEEVYHKATRKFYYRKVHDNKTINPNGSLSFDALPIPEDCISSYKVYIKRENRLFMKKNLASLDKKRKVDFYNKKSQLKKLSKNGLEKIIKTQNGSKIREEFINNPTLQNYVASINKTEKISKVPEFLPNLWIPPMYEVDEVRWRGVLIIESSNSSLFYRASEDKKLKRNELINLFVFIDHLRSVIYYRNRREDNDTGEQIKYYYTNKTKEIESALLSHQAIVSNHLALERMIKEKNQNNTRRT